MNKADYSTTNTPKDYKCSQCKATGCKLWRDASFFSPSLFCVDCAAKTEKKDVSTMDAEGRRDSDHGGKTDQIGWCLPAVPTEDGLGYWGYTSVPERGVQWWKKLPLRAPEKATKRATSRKSPAKRKAASKSKSKAAPRKTTRRS